MGIEVKRNMMEKGWKRFMIMSQDRRVASIREDGTCTIYAKRLMPYDLYMEPVKSNDLDTRINNRENFYHWCASRVLTLDRKYAKEILNTIGAKQAVTDRDRATIALSYHALSLTDVYWIKAADEKVTFAELSLFRHSLSGAFSDVSLSGKQLTVQNEELLTRSDVAGDVGTQGVAPKAWIRENGTFYLLKNGDARDVEAELLASKIIRCFDVKSVTYEPSTFDKKLVSKSEIITSEDYSITTMEAVEVYCLNHNKEPEDFVLEQDPYHFHMMNLIDYLVGNTDRHWGNWGFLVENTTNKLCGLFPLMDFNKSFQAYDSLDGARCQTIRSRKLTQREAALEAVHAVGLNQIHEVQTSWFKDTVCADMFFRRLELLQQAAKT